MLSSNSVNLPTVISHHHYYLHLLSSYTLVSFVTRLVINIIIIIINLSYLRGWVANRAVRRTLRPPHPPHHCPPAAGVPHQGRVQTLLKRALSTTTRTMATQRRPLMPRQAQLKGRTCEPRPVHLHILPFLTFHPSSTTTSLSASSGQCFLFLSFLNAFSSAFCIFICIWPPYDSLSAVFTEKRLFTVPSTSVKLAFKFKETLI